MLDFWTNFVKPPFEAANPGITLNLVDAGDGAGNIAIGERALAALQQNADPQADYFESYDPRLPAGGIEAGLFVNLKEAGLSNWSKINPLAIDIDYSMPYRGSQVLLAYDTAKLKPEDAPKTFADAHRLDQGQPRPVHLQPARQGRIGRQLRPPRHLRGERQGPGRPSPSTTSPTTSPPKALEPAWKILQDLAPSLFDEGAYTSGNTQSLQLLGQSRRHHDPGLVRPGARRRSTTGVLPETTGLVQLTDLALPGGFSRSVVLRERRQQGRRAQARRLHPHRGDPERRPRRARRLPRRLLGPCLRRSCARSTRT